MNRRGFLRQLGLVIAAPAIVRATSLMKVVPWDEPLVLPPTTIRTSIPNRVWRMLYQGVPLQFQEEINAILTSPLDL